MLLEFRISNFRSIRDETVFTMVAEPSRSKGMNYWDQALAGSEPVRLLKIAALYGANASGKSNLLRAVSTIRRMLTHPVKAGDEIWLYEPFEFDVDTRDAPTVFDLTFVGPENVKYRYFIRYDEELIHEELLEYYPKGNKRICFHRVDEGEGELVCEVKMGADFRKRKLSIFCNQLLLGKFGGEEADKILSEVFLSFKRLTVLNASNDRTVKGLKKFVAHTLANNKKIHEKLNQIICNADVKISSTEIKELKEEDYKFPNDFPEEDKNKIIEKNRFMVYGAHDLFQNKKAIGKEMLEFEDESQGTNTLFVLGGIILIKLREGGILFVDELDTSLHPDLTRMLVQLFQSEETNPQNAQLVFTTHDTNLMDSALLRKDQVWFAEKDEFGGSEFFSLQDFEGVRETTPFQKWYGAGKFGAKPNIRIMEKLNPNTKTQSTNPKN